MLRTVDIGVLELLCRALNLSRQLTADEIQAFLPTLHSLDEIQLSLETLQSKDFAVFSLSDETWQATEQGIETMLNLSGGAFYDHLLKRVQGGGDDADG